MKGKANVVREKRLDKYLRSSQGSVREGVVGKRAIKNGGRYIFGRVWSNGNTSTRSEVLPSPLVYLFGLLA